MKRMWINQPSTNQPFHSRHGTNVLADEPGHLGSVTIYFLDGPTISALVGSDILSPGWVTLKKNSIYVAFTHEEVISGIYRTLFAAQQELDLKDSHSDPNFEWNQRPGIWGPESTWCRVDPNNPDPTDKPWVEEWVIDDGLVIP